MTEDSWRAAKAALLWIEKQLKIKEKKVEVPSAKSIAAINVKDNLPTAWQTEKTTKKMISPRLKLTNSQEQILVSQVTDRMRLSRQRAAIIDMGLVLLTVALVSCACLWEKASLLLPSCLLLGPISWSLFLGACGHVMGIKVVGVALSLAAATVVNESCPFSGLHLTWTFELDTIFEVSYANVYALSGISVASALTRSTSDAVWRSSLWGFLLPIIAYADLLWIPATKNCNWNAHSIILAVADMIFTLLTIVFIHRERCNVSFLSAEELKIVQTKQRKVEEHELFSFVW